MRWQCNFCWKCCTQNVPKWQVHSFGSLLLLWLSSSLLLLLLLLLLGLRHWQDKLFLGVIWFHYVSLIHWLFVTTVMNHPPFQAANGSNSAAWFCTSWKPDASDKHFKRILDRKGWVEVDVGPMSLYKSMALKPWVESFLNFHTSTGKRTIPATTTQLTTTQHIAMHSFLRTFCPWKRGKLFPVTVVCSCLQMPGFKRASHK